MLGPLFGLGPNSGRKKPLIICISTKKTLSIYTVGERGREKESKPFHFASNCKFNLRPGARETEKEKEREEGERSAFAN